MNRLQIIGVIAAALSLIGYGYGRFVTPFPDWALRFFGILMLAAMCVLVFSTARNRMGKK